MDKITIPLNEIRVLPQPRREFRNIDELADDIRSHGLIQPPTITKDKRLLYGERRYRACKLLDLQTIPVLVCEETLSDDEILERQIAENVARDDLSWQERALALLDLWRIKKQRGNLEGWDWGQREASSLFKIALGTVNYILRVAKKLEQELKLPEDQRKYWKFSSANEAWRNGILLEKQDEMTAELARRTLTQTNSQPAIASPLSSSENEQHIPSAVDVINFDQAADVVKQEARERYEKNPLNTQPFEEYWAERESEIKKRREESNNIINISNILYHGDCIEFMNRDENQNRFDHIITDIPYGIDISNMAQQGAGQIVDIDRIADTHVVGDNLDLHEQFFKAAFKCTKEHSFVVTFCDMMEFRRMHDLACEAGFAVQRWPLIWKKINQSVANSSAGYNTTKDYEIAIVCRKKGATLASKLNTSILEGGNTLAVKETGHPFAKPYEITKKICEAVSTPNQLILEPFAGGGSIALEILRNNRQVVACELEAHHYNLLMENLKREYYLKLNPKFIFR